MRRCLATYLVLLMALLLTPLAVAPVSAQSDESADTLTAERAPVIDRDVFSSRLELTPIEIEAAPYQDMRDVMTSHVGVNKDSKGADDIQFRGTGLEGADVIVDGISQNDPHSNFPTYSINLDAIESIEIETSGFTADYGNVRSGVINIRTKGDDGPPALINIEDDELARVAAAFVSIARLRYAFDEGTISSEQFQQRTVTAILDQNVSLERYSEVLGVAQSNSRLQSRLLDLARQIDS